MSAPRSRQYRRVAQACDNCRYDLYLHLACTRLRQACSFSDARQMSEDSASKIETRMSSRLEQLEDKLDSLINRVGPQSLHETTPSTASERNKRLPSFSSIAPDTSLSFSALTPNNTATRAIEFYFRHIHRQPLWLFDDHSLPNPETSEDLIYAILAISTIYGATEFSGDDLQNLEVYNKTARKGVMLKIAEGNITIQSIQTLCLLAYFNFVSGDIAMAGFDIALAKNMIQLTPDQDSRSNSLTHPQEKSKLFWSLHFLSFTCGAPVLLPSIQDSINTPRLSTIETQSPLTHCIATPRVSAGHHETLVNIWPESLKICGLWSDVRLLLKTADEKGLRLADPFFAQAAAIASIFYEAFGDVAAPQFPNYSDQPSEGRPAWGGNSSTDDEQELPQPDVSSPPTDMRESTVHYASPPAWVMGRAESDSQVGSAEAGDGETIAMHDEVAGDDVAANSLAWGPWENLGPMGENFCMNMDWWDMSQF
ncbi:hypothetical protein HG530_001659 [Fusarium avenaceum]|nr:hypothetical protein HG530_001659 [Fusarium avenaceum]